MGIKTDKSPYYGLWIFLPIMVLPSIVITWVLYLVIMKWQARFGQELNWASAKIFGCGCGIMFHISCWLMGVFTDEYMAVKLRMKEFSENIVDSAKLAFSCYWEDVKALGLAFWIDVAVIVANAAIFADAIVTYLVLRGF